MHFHAREMVVLDLILWVTIICFINGFVTLFKVFAHPVKLAADLSGNVVGISLLDNCYVFVFVEFV